MSLPEEARPWRPGRGVNHPRETRATSQRERNDCHEQSDPRPGYATRPSPLKPTLPCTESKKWSALIGGASRSWVGVGGGVTGGSNSAIGGRAGSARRGGLAGASDRGEGATSVGWENRGAVERDLRWRHGINGPRGAGTVRAHGHGKAHGERACKGTWDFLSFENGRESIGGGVLVGGWRS